MLGARIQLQIDETGVEKLSWLRLATGCRTLREIFNNAITLLDWAVKQRMAGRTIAAVDEAKDEYRALEMPALNYAADHPIEEGIQVVGAGT